MTNPFYNHTSLQPVAISRGTSLPIRAEFDAIQAGFDLVLTAIANAAFQVTLPNQSGNNGAFARTDGTNVTWKNAGPMRLVSGASDTLTASDNDGFVRVSVTCTLAFSPVAAMGANWHCIVKNTSSTGFVTVDPSGAELVDGLGSYIMYPLESRLFWSDGSAIYSVVLEAFLLTATSSFTFTKPPGYSALSGYLWGGGGGGTTSGGGGGGYCNVFTFESSKFAASCSCTIGAGGIGAAAGGTSSFDFINATGGGHSGGGGGGFTNAGVSAAGAGGAPANNTTYGGGAGSASAAGGISMFGGGGGTITTQVGGNSGYGGGGGGITGGISIYGGNGGAVDQNGVAPGGGAGPTTSGTKNGARGELRLWGVL